MKAALFILLLAFSAGNALSQEPDSAFQADEAVAKTKAMIEKVANDSYKDVKLTKIRIKTFESDTSFFKARYSVWRYTTFQPMRHLIFVNPKAFEKELPENAFQSIIAHELSHVSYYTRKNRFQLLGLVRLTTSGATAGFERKADLETIEKGYGEGLIAYREWLFRNIPDSKREIKSRVYFTPAEISLVMRAVGEKPAVVEKWRKDVPRDIETIRRDTGYG